MSFPPLVASELWSAEAPCDSPSTPPPLLYSAEELCQLMQIPYPDATAAGVSPSQSLFSSPDTNATTISSASHPGKRKASINLPAPKDMGPSNAVRAKIVKTSCQYCPLVMRKDNLIRHLATSCPGNRVFMKKEKAVCVCGKKLSRQDALRRHIEKCRVASACPSDATSSGSSASSTPSMVPSNNFTFTTEFPQQPAQLLPPIGLGGPSGLYTCATQPFASAVPHAFSPFTNQLMHPSFEAGNATQVYPWWDVFYRNQMAATAHGYLSYPVNNYYYPYYANANGEVVFPSPPQELNNLGFHAATVPNHVSGTYGFPASVPPESSQPMNYD